MFDCLKLKIRIFEDSNAEIKIIVRLLGHSD